MATSKTDYEKLKERYADISIANDRMRQFLKQKLDLSLDTLPETQKELISHYANAKKVTELHALETSYFEEWFLLRCEKKFNDMEIIDDLALAVAKYQEELDEDNRKIIQVEAFLNDHGKSSDQSDNELVVIEQKLAGAQTNYEEILKQEPPYCLEALLEKLNELEN